MTDQTGAAVPGTTVTLTNPNTGFKRTVTTGNDGKYNFPGIPSGTYQLEAAAGNFKKTLKRDIQALVDLPIEISLTLEAGDVSAVVDVTSDTIESVVNTQDATIGNNFVPAQITQLPTDLRRVTDLLSLQPGVTREGYTAGARSDQTNVTLDGVDINDQQTGGRTSQFDLSQGTAIRLTTEAVEEFRITTTNANANQGRSSGAQVSLVTKSGTNEFHGAGFYFYRPTEFSANDFFSNSAGVERPSLSRDIFGGAIGGPILKDKIFFFYSYEAQREESEVPVVRLVPLPNLGRGELRFEGTGPTCTNGICTINTATFNNIYSSVRQNPVTVAILADAAARYPANDTSVGDQINTSGFRFNSPQTIRENTHIARFDWNITDSQQLFLRGNYQWDNALTASFFPDTPAPNTWSHPYGFVVGHNWTVSSNKINNFRYGLTRQAFSTQGDSSENAVSFRFVFQPKAFSRTGSRVTPVHNITDDFTWIKGNHTMQFGTNIRIIRNQRTSFGNAFDSVTTNPSVYDQSGRAVLNELTANGYTLTGNTLNIQGAASALIGRLSSYTSNFTFDLDGSILPAGTPTERTFATEEYDVYAQDIWRPFSNLTLTYGLRYGYSRPVYEKNGFQVVPTEPLGEFFERRQASAAQGVPLNDLIQFEFGGPANNGPGFYKSDWNNFQPSVAVAWSPNFRRGFLHTLFGNEGDSVLRGGFRIVNDYFGQQLAVSFDGLSAIGFTADSSIAANTYNVTTRPAPLFTGFGQDVRSLPGLSAPVQNLSFVPSAACLAGTSQCPQRIEASLDANAVSPINYSWNVSYGRSLPKGIYFEASYVGRAARNLLATRDVMQLNNLVDPQSGMDWYTAAGMLHDLFYAGTPIDQVPTIPYFENLFPTLRFGQPNATRGVYLANQLVSYGDWTFLQSFLDDRGTTPNLFFHPQYAALSTFSTVASSDYHGGIFSLRQRLGNWLSYDINYTFSKSMDDASGLQTGGLFFGDGFILNSLRPEDNRSVSDFDVRHIINANFIVQLPFGKGKMIDTQGLTTDFFLGGWQLAGVFRYNTGLPLNTSVDGVGWATNWQIRSIAVRTAPIQTSPTRGENGQPPNLFSNLDLLTNSLRLPRPGETGDRNAFRNTGYSVLDMSLNKTFTFPWNENHKLQFRWEVFNVLNKQHLAGAGTGVYFPADPFIPGDQPSLSSTTGQFTGTRGNPRRMQFGLRFSF